ncbi:glutaredoxin 3 [Rickettsiales bacterium]|nr:glutaredoxin 3 [Rickettsiales bacterium]
MLKILIYTKNFCPFCVRAKSILKQHNIAFKEVDITGDESLHAEVMEKSGGRRTVPQIFFGDRHIGGCDDLETLANAGKLRENISNGSD